MNELADQIVRKVFSSRKARDMTKEEMMEQLDKSMCRAAWRLGQLLEDPTDNEGHPIFPLTDMLQTFKVLREFQIAQWRMLGKNDPETNSKEPSEIAKMREALQSSKDEHAAKEPRVVKTGEIDKRHENPGRPPGEGLEKRMAKARAAQQRAQQRTKRRANGVAMADGPVGAQSEPQGEPMSEAQ